MTKYFIIALLTGLFSLNPIVLLRAQDVTVSWDPSPSAEVTGYKIYYQQDNANLPLNGSGASEGPSPVDAGNNLSFTLTDLPDSVPHYMGVTAYNALGDESDLSNIVSVNNSGTISLVRPAANAQDEPIPTTFQWAFDLTYPTLEYTLYYGTDAGQVVSAGTLFRGYPPSSRENRFIVWGLFATLILIGLYQIAGRKWKMAFGVLAFSLALCACGGGDGGTSNSSSNKTSNEPPNIPNSAAVLSINKGSSDYHQAFDLQPGTTYYWKVIGVELSDPTHVYTSSVASFTTEAF